jgi:nucleotide-binding universal stress UspA family protein
MFHKILVPTDGSPAALHAAEFVTTHLAPNRGTKVTVVIVIAPIGLKQTDFDVEFVEQQNRRIRKNAECVLAKITDVFARNNIAVTARILEGNPVSAEIAREATDGGYDLIVMSSRGMGKQSDSLHYIGSVTEHVMRRVNVPVLVIPPPEAS